jgi:hypothetical protein
MHTASLTFCFSLFLNSNALEELSVRADIAFNQKKVVHLLLGDDDDETENELRTISAQLVRTSSVYSYMF